ncbi:MAG TPA: DUF5674 family protein [Thermoanaerobaculia bacterium]|jgi:hypothetical protein|nr:DUF5674 family protein [Thermoanaerobaculia bacterium]
MSEGPEIVMVDADHPIESTELSRLTDLFFKDMVKYVVDIERRVAAIGGELHADAEEMLLEAGSRQNDLWGANFYPDKDPDERIEYTSLINIRPGQGNRSMFIEDPMVRERVRDVTLSLIGTEDLHK